MEKKINTDASREDVSKVYARDTAYNEDLAKNYDAFRFTKESGKAIHTSEKNCLLRAVDKINAGSKVLEVGCGTGRLLVELGKLGYKVDGADASGSMLEELKSKFINSEHEPKLMICDAANLPAEDATYDLTYSIRLLNQTESPEYALSVVKEIVRVTKPSGYCLIEFVNQHRPRLGANKRPTTRLSPKDVLEATKEVNGQLVNWDGAFFLSMQAYHLSPNFLLGAVSTLDRALSALFPRLCSRCYILIQKQDS